MHKQSVNLTKIRFEFGLDVGRRIHAQGTPTISVAVYLFEKQGLPPNFTWYPHRAHMVYIIYNTVGQTIRTSGQVVRALDYYARHQWFEPNLRIIVGMFPHCTPSSKWVPGGNTGEVKDGEERN